MLNREFGINTTEKDFSNWVIDNFYRFKQIETNFDALVEWNKRQASLVNQ